jgi:hypothetical protein
LRHLVDNGVIERFTGARPHITEYVQLTSEVGHRAKFIAPRPTVGSGDGVDSFCSPWTWLLFGASRPQRQRKRAACA